MLLIIVAAAILSLKMPSLGCTTSSVGGQPMCKKWQNSTNYHRSSSHIYAALFCPYPTNQREGQARIGWWLLLSKMARITEIAQCIQEFFKRKSQCLKITEKEKLEISFYNLAILGAKIQIFLQGIYSNETFLVTFSNIVITRKMQLTFMNHDWFVDKSIVDNLHCMFLPLISIIRMNPKVIFIIHWVTYNVLMIANLSCSIIISVLWERGCVKVIPNFAFSEPK